jgi:hypothetical protein
MTSHSRSCPCKDLSRLIRSVSIDDVCALAFPQRRDNLEFKSNPPDEEGLVTNLSKLHAAIPADQCRTKTSHDSTHLSKHQNPLQEIPRRRVSRLGCIRNMPTPF